MEKSLLFCYFHAHTHTHSHTHTHTHTHTHAYTHAYTTTLQIGRRNKGSTKKLRARIPCRATQRNQGLNQELGHLQPPDGNHLTATTCPSNNINTPNAPSPVDASSVKALVDKTTTTKKKRHHKRTRSKKGVTLLVEHSRRSTRERGTTNLCSCLKCRTGRPHTYTQKALRDPHTHKARGPCVTRKP